MRQDESCAKDNIVEKLLVGDDPPAHLLALSGADVDDDK